MRNWKMRVDVAEFLQDESLSFEERRDGIVKALDDLVLLDVEPVDQVRFEDAVDGLRYSEDKDEFDQHWDDLYDWADDNALWVEGF